MWSIPRVSADRPIIEEREREVRARAEAFDLLRATALPPADSAELIRAISTQISG